MRRIFGQPNPVPPSSSTGTPNLISFTPDLSLEDSEQQYNTNNNYNTSSSSTGGGAGGGKGWLSSRNNTTVGGGGGEEGGGGAGGGGHNRNGTEDSIQSSTFNYGSNSWNNGPSTSTSTTSKIGYGKKGNGRITEDEEEEDESSNKLPFSTFRRISSAPPLDYTSINGRAFKSTITSSSSISRIRAGGGGGGGRDSPELMVTKSSTSIVGGGEEKDSIMVELLSSQALMESREYQIMDWDEMLEVKKEHTLLASKVASLSRSLALETKLRDTASKLVRASLPRSSSSPAFSATSSSSSSTRPRVTREQAESQLSTANSKISTLSSDLYQIGWKESQLRTQLLQHNAGILALSTTRQEESIQGLPPSPLPNSHSFNSQLSGTTTGGARRVSSSLSIDSNLTQRMNGIDSLKFEGHHFYSGNKDAVIPSAKSPPFLSPRTTPVVAVFPNDISLVRDLELQVDKLRQDLINVSQEKNSSVKDLEIQLDGLKSAALRSKRSEEMSKGDGDVNKREMESLKRSLEISKRDLDSSQLEIERIRSEADTNRREADNHRREADSTRREGESNRGELENYRSDLAEAKRQVNILRGELEDSKTGRSRENEGKLASATALQSELAAAKREAADVTKKLSLTKLEWEEAQHRTNLAEKQTMELEEELSTFRSKSSRELIRLQSEINSLENKTRGLDPLAEAQLKEDLITMKEEKRQVSQSIGDVLRRHRTRPAIGPILRDLPPFEDTIDRNNLAQYLSTTLDSHFDALAAHVNDLSNDLSSVQSNQDESRSGMQMEIKQAVDHRERWRAEAESHRTAKEDLEIVHRDLKARVRDLEGQLSGYSSLQRDLSNAKEDEQGLKGELEAARLELTNAEIQVADLSSQQSKMLSILSELWRTIPPVENRQANSRSDDLNVLRAAFELPKKGRSSFIAGLANTNSHTSEKFTVESLAERIRILLAEDAKLVAKLINFSMEQDTHKGNAERAHTMLTESKAGIQVYQKQVKDLENRMEVSMNQEVTMLERLNDLTESLEETRASKRKLETSVSSSQSQFRALEADIVSLKSNLVSAQSEVTRLSSRVDNTAKLAQLENQLSEVHDELNDAQEELEDAKKRESQQRSRLLDELSQLQQEVSGLKTKLRQAERKK